MQTDFTLGPCRLILGDCHTILPSIRSQVDAIVTDPPYGINFCHGEGGHGLTSPTNSLHPIIGDDKPFDPSPWLQFHQVILFGANHFAPRLPEGKGDWIAWDKSCGQGPSASFFRKGLSTQASMGPGF